MRTLTNTPADGGEADTPAAPRYAALLAVVADVARRRDAGEHVPDDAVAAGHPDLMPELGQRLTALRMFRRGLDAGRRAAAGAASPVVGPVAVAAPCVPVGLLDSPILPAEAGVGEGDAGDPSSCGDDAYVPAGARPLIPGYQIIREVSAGGQGAVFKAVQESTGRAVAVKVLPAGVLAGAARRARFEREGRVLAGLDDPHVVRIVDRGQTAAGALYLVMDFVAGPPLDAYADACRQAGPAGVRRLLRTMAHLAAAVGRAHAAGVVHRDLKPSNVLVDPGSGTPRLLDFGLARVLGNGEYGPGTDITAADAVTLSGQVVGSLPWASPEQVAGRSAAVGPAADVYALGVCLYAALTGRHPYPLDGSVADVVGRIRTAAAAPLGRVAGACREHVQRVLDKCLAKAAGDRYPTAAALAADLDALADGRVPAAPPRARRRWAARYGPLAAAVTLAVGAAGWRVWAGNGRPALPRGVTVFPLPVLTDSAGIRLVRVPAGRVAVGVPETDPRRRPGGQAPAAVVWRPLYVGVREVDRAQWALVMGLPAPPPDQALLPATGMTALEADEFCRRLSATEHAVYRLPTEAEWEYACRAGSERAWAGTGVPDEMGWHAGNAGGRPHPPFERSPNHWGLYDAHGNAAEWCLDTWDGSTNRPTAAPGAGQAADAPRAVRGGSYARTAAESASAARATLPPDARRADVGFRVVREPETRQRT